ncbi:LysR substrate-binding domain-containing protein [Sphingomonas sp. LB3N6]|uniref:LysR family transcriptional regulator n=1 Tax=Sphingomonas fucosidasi TaxID=3096164 RepID=UPI002FC82914
MTRHLEQRLKIRHLRVIEALDQHKSLLRASKALRVSQPALSRTLQEVEDIVGGTIFERHARGVRANAMGRLLAQGAQRLLGTMRQMEVDLGELFLDRKRSIRVGALPVAAHGLLPAVLAHASSEAGQLSIEVIEGLTDQLIPSLLSGDVDIIVGRLYEPPTPDGLIRRVLYSEPISLVARCDHPLFELEAPTNEDLQRFKIVSPAVSTRVEQDVRATLSSIGLQADGSIRSTSVGFMRELLLAGTFVSAMPRILVAGDLSRGLLRIVPIALPPGRRIAGVIYRDILGEAGTLLLSEIRRELERLAQDGIVDLAGPD